MKIRLLGAELAHEEGRADKLTDRHDEAKSNFRSSPNAPKKKGGMSYSRQTKILKK